MSDKIIDAIMNYRPDQRTLNFVKENHLTMKRSEIAKKLNLPKYIVNRLVEVVRE